MRYAEISVDEDYAVNYRGTRRGVVTAKDDATKRVTVQFRFAATETGGDLVNVGEPKTFPTNRLLRTWAAHEEMERRLADRQARREDAQTRIAAALAVPLSKVRMGARNNSVTVPLDALERVIAALHVDWEERQEAV